MINDKLDTLAGLQLPITTKQYELRIRCGHLTTFNFQIDGKVLTSSDRLKSESDLENESDLREVGPGY